MSYADPFFRYARERYTIFLKKEQNLPRPWTDDKILSHFKFCNVFREDDRTTRWFRDNVREPMRSQPEVLLATVLFRWFNRIETGEAIFQQTSLLGYENTVPAKTAWDVYLEDGDPLTLKTAIAAARGRGPVVTGAYCIIGRGGMPKLDGVLAVFHNAATTKQPYMDGELASWQDVAANCLEYPGNVRLEDVWNWFRRYERSGDFMAYEVVCDLMYTDLLCDAPDRTTWANAGPGAVRGLNRLHGRPLTCNSSKEQTCREMRDLLGESRELIHWPSRWPAWDMRTVEHTLCEFDKYERLRLGEGRVKGVYR